MSRSDEDPRATYGASQTRNAIIRDLNDQLRRLFAGGHVLLTPGIRATPPTTLRNIIRAVCRFTAFTPDNDPHDEHDFGSVEVAGIKLFWKIDYYDLGLEYGSPDPADPSVTTRVLTIMLREEY